MKTLPLSVLFVICICTIHFGQTVDINTGTQMPPVAILDVTADSSGVLFPRTDTSKITSPVEGLIIYDINDHAYRFFNGTQWLDLLTSNQFNFWYPDQDGDGFGNSFSALYAPVPPAGYIALGGDCDDKDAAINPDGTEICDGVDNDCNGDIDDMDADVTGQMLFYVDADLDGYGDDQDAGTLACTAPPGMVENNLDCDDTDGAINPEADEICDGIDNDCDAAPDDADSDLVGGTSYYPDADMDNYGDANASATIACSPPLNMVENNLDCDDTRADINPEADEICDEIDNNCNGTTDENVTDIDDGIDCTDDSCNGGVIQNVIQADKCLINGVCFDNGTTNPSNECQECNTSLSQTQWSSKANGTLCSGGSCLNGSCALN